MKAYTACNIAFILAVYGWTGYLVGYANMFRFLGWIALGLIVVGLIPATAYFCWKIYRRVESLSRLQLPGIGH
jgi:hypothetical protein